MYLCELNLSAKTLERKNAKCEKITVVITDHHKLVLKNAVFINF